MGRQLSGSSVCCTSMKIGVQTPTYIKAREVWQLPVSPTLGRQRLVIPGTSWAARPGGIGEH